MDEVERRRQLVDKFRKDATGIRKEPMMASTCLACGSGKVSSQIRSSSTTVIAKIVECSFIVILVGIVGSLLMIEIL